MSTLEQDGAIWSPLSVTFTASSCSRQLCSDYAVIEGSVQSSASPTNQSEGVKRSCSSVLVHDSNGRRKHVDADGWLFCVMFFFFSLPSRSKQVNQMYLNLTHTLARQFRACVNIKTQVHVFTGGTTASQSNSAIQKY